MEKDDQVLKALGFVIFEPAQVSRYYDRIRLPQQHRHAAGPMGSGSPSAEVARSPGPGLDFLTALVRHHLSSIPFENLSLHYSPSHTVTIAHDSLYDKMVTKTTTDGRSCNRGGYCMESNGLFLAILRSLGFNVYATGARIGAQLNDPGLSPLFEGWSHQVNIVRFGSSRYVVDVGLGSFSPTRPVLLDPSVSKPLTNVAPGLMRLQRGPILDSTSRDATNEGWWTYQVLRSPEESSKWISASCFSELEFIHDDFEIMNHFTSTSPRFWMKHKVVCTKVILDDLEEPIGILSLAGGTCKRQINGKSEILAECSTEAERVDALEKHFGILLTRDERRGVFGLPSALRGAQMYG